MAPPSDTTTEGSAGPENSGAEQPGAETSGAPRGGTRARSVSWIVVRLAAVVGVAAGIAYNLVGLPGLRDVGDYYRLDLDVYRIGGGVFAAGGALYGEMPTTVMGTNLPFTYPPIAAVIFSPLSAITLHDASLVVTALSIMLLFATIVLTLRSLGYSPRSMLLWSAVVVLAIALMLEPVSSTLDYGQINIVLMAFVAADALPKKTLLPRGVLIGLVAAVKLTPAVFVLFFLIRKDFRAAVIAGISFAAFTALGFLATWSDSVTYWTSTLIDSDRIGKPAYPPNQSITGVLARLGLSDSVRSIVWILLSLLVLLLAMYAMRRAVRADQIALTLGINAMAGLLVSPVSWSHHWVWAIPMTVVLATLGFRKRSPALLAFVALGVVLMRFPPHWKLGEGRWSGLEWPLIDQFAASSYVWWGLAALVIAATASWQNLAPRTADAKTGPALTR